MRTIVGLLMIGAFCVTLSCSQSKSSESSAESASSDASVGSIETSLLHERLDKTDKLPKDAKVLVETFLEKSARESIGVMKWVEFSQEYAKTKSFPAAMPVFEFGTELFPKSTLAFYFLGDALVETGDTAKAIEQFDHAVQLDERNSCARDIATLLRNPGDSVNFMFVCPPCYCNQHKYKFKTAKYCIQCGMELAKREQTLSMLHR
jgi:tetratricopeptide (TPR) repeat protein